MYRLVAILVVLLLGTALAPVRADQASDLHDMQDFESDPPLATGPLAQWILWVRQKQDGTYKRSGGQPFMAPIPPGLPAGVTAISVRTTGGTNVTSSGGVECTEAWIKDDVVIDFDDGSRFTWTRRSSSTACSDGSFTNDGTVTSSAGRTVVAGGVNGRLRRWDDDNGTIARRASFLASVGETVDLSSQLAAALPLVGSGWNVDVTVGPAGMLDLRGNDPFAGPLFETDGPVTLRCDTVLLDPGVVLADLFQPPPLVLPAAVVHELALDGPVHAYHFDPGSAFYEFTVTNLGNAADTVQLGWSDTALWALPGPSPPVAVDPLVPTAVQVPLLFPPGLQPGDESTLTAQTISAMSPVAQSDALLVVVATPPTPSVYCTAKTNTQSCVPQIGWTGAPTLTGYDDLVIVATDVLNLKNGLMFYGSGPASIPFLGATLCVQPPLKRTPVQNSGGTVGPPDCSGIYGFQASHAFLNAANIAPGAQIHCQYWSRDPAASFGAGLTNAVALTIGP